MSVQIALLAPATRVASRKLGPTAGRRSGARRRAARGLRDEQVGEHVRQVRDARHQAVVGRRRRSPSGCAPKRAQQPVQALVEHARRCCRRRASDTRWRRRTDPRARARRRRSRRRRADARRRSARRRRDVGEQALGRADVADHAVRPGAARAPARTVSRERADGRGDEHDVGARDAPRRRRRPACRSRRARARGARTLRVGVIAADLARPARPRAARPIEPPISPTPRTATFKERCPAGACVSAPIRRR